MKLFGSQFCGFSKTTETQNELSLFHVRLHLLLIMVKARLKGFPLGKYRTEAVLENAAQVHKDISKLELPFLESGSSAHLFRERVKLLSVMATAMVSDDYPLGIHRREAVLDNIDIIIETAFPGQNLVLFHDILKAA